MRALGVLELSPAPSGGWWRGPWQVLRLAVADFAHERRLSLCAVIGLAAVLAPLLVLYGLKFGIVSTMTAQLTSDPRAREVRPLGQGSYDDAFLARLAAHPAAGYLEPTTRFLAASLSLRNPAIEAEPLNAEMWPTRPGDPLLPAGVARPLDTGQVVLSRTAADKLRAGPGTTLEARVGRTRQDGEPERARLTVTVAAVAAPGRIERDVALVAPALLTAAEDYRDGWGNAALGWAGDPRPDGPRRYASFRLFARDIDGVAPLRDHLTALGIDSNTRLAEIELVRGLDRNLTTLFLLIAGLASAGYFLSLAINLWATTARKRKELAVLRLLGLSSGSIALFPALNALLTSTLGTLLAIGLYLAVEPAVNRMFGEGPAGGRVVCRLDPPHFALGAAVTLGVALAASLGAGLSAARVSPSQGLRDE